MNENMFVPEVGRHPGIDNLVYHEHWDAVNASRLARMDQSPMHCRWFEVHTEPLTDTQRKNYLIGQAVHCAILEPTEFESRYAPDPQHPEKGGYPQGWRNTKIYRQLKAEVLASGFIPLPLEEWDRCRYMRDSIYEEESDARALIGDAMTASEVSYVGDDPVTGLRCKVRPDILVDETGVIGDLKSCRDASYDACSAEIYRLGYFRSAPFYRDVMNWVDGGKWKHHVFLFVEKEPPYGHQVFDLDPASMVAGERSYRRLLNAYARCLENGEWPGYSTTTRSIGIPRWAHTREQEEERWQ